MRSTLALSVCLSILVGSSLADPDPQYFNLGGRRPPPAPKDPCNPTPCGPNTTCTKSPNGNAICRCIANFIPKPDTITGCGPECVRDPDCERGFICDNQR